MRLAPRRKRERSSNRKRLDGRHHKKGGDAPTRGSENARYAIERRCLVVSYLLFADDASRSCNKTAEAMRGLHDLANRFELRHGQISDPAKPALEERLHTDRAIGFHSRNDGLRRVH